MSENVYILPHRIGKGGKDVPVNFYPEPEPRHFSMGQVIRGYKVGA